MKVALDLPCIGVGKVLASDKIAFILLVANINTQSSNDENNI